MIDNYERLVGRLMDLETKFYELQERYHHLINEYEKLKAQNETDSIGHRNESFSRCDSCMRDEGH